MIFKDFVSLAQVAPGYKCNNVSNYEGMGVLSYFNPEVQTKW
jgi:hypothetical protein